MKPCPWIMNPSESGRAFSNTLLLMQDSPLLKMSTSTMATAYVSTAKTKTGGGRPDLRALVVPILRFFTKQTFLTILHLVQRATQTAIAEDLSKSETMCSSSLRKKKMAHLNV